MRVFAELSEAGNAIDVHFPYDPGAVAAIKRVSGKRFVPKDKGGPFWRVPLDVTTGQRLREEFGQGLVLGEGLKAWGRDEIAKQRNLRSLSRANDAELRQTPENILRLIRGDAFPEWKEELPDDSPLLRERDPRPYQRADIAMMAQANVLNANQPGTGKTIEEIGSWFEAGLERESHLVIAPVRSLMNVWAEELWRWAPTLPVFTAEDPITRQGEVGMGLQAIENGEPGVTICINPDMIRLEKLWDAKKSEGDPPTGPNVARRDHKGHVYGYKNELVKQLLDVDWGTVTIDEFHKHGLPNRSSLFSMACGLLKAKKKTAMSGTPIGGRPRKLWAILNYLEPNEYTSEWRWIEQWLETEEGYNGSKIVGDIAPGREDGFYEAHARHMVRRMKREALPGLPLQNHVIVKCQMTRLQQAQYSQFAAESEIRIEEERLAAQNVLSEYARLKQFANAKQKLIDGVPYPTEDSDKLEQLLEKLDEEGIRKTDPEPGARAVIASESSRMVYMVAEFLKKKGLACDTMTGDTKDTHSIVKRFQGSDPEPYIIVMTIQTGGVSLNLERAGSMHALDETWNPDDMEQFFDRGDRGSRQTSLNCYTYRTENTIQEYIAEINEGKKVTNRNILDLRRQMYKEAS